MSRWAEIIDVIARSNRDLTAKQLIPAMLIVHGARFILGELPNNTGF